METLVFYLYCEKNVNLNNLNKLTLQTLQSGGLTWTIC